MMHSLRLTALAGLVAGALALAGSSSASGPSANSAIPTGLGLSVGPLASTPLTVAVGTNPGNAQGKSLKIPAGWTAEVWANVPGVRMAAWSPDGRLIVTTGAGGSVKSLTPTTEGHAPTIKTLLKGLPGAQGLGFGHSGTVLVIGEDSRIVAVDYLNGSVSNGRVIVNNLPTSGHGAKGIAVKGDAVYYSLGSSGNRTPWDRTATPKRATVWRVNINGNSNTAIAKGVRNGFALAIAPDGTVFTAVNQMDNQPYPFHYQDQYGTLIRSYINANPVDQVTRLTQGVDLGWPYCVPDTRNTPTRLNVPYVNDPEFNPTGSKLNCKGLPKTMLGLPAHSAPLGLSFTTRTALEPAIGLGALITTHGSWNRTPPRAPVVLFSPWNSTAKRLGAPVTLIAGFQNPDGTRWGRCVDAVVGPDGSLYVTDDMAGLVYRITPAGYGRTEPGASARQ